jgi:hypothetical protein
MIAARSHGQSHLTPLRRHLTADSELAKNREVSEIGCQVVQSCDLGVPDSRNIDRYTMGVATKTSVRGQQGRDARPQAQRAQGATRTMLLVANL